MDALIGSRYIRAVGRAVPDLFEAVGRDQGADSIAIGFGALQNLAQLRELTNDRTWFETVQLCIAPMVACATPAEIAAQIAAVPEARWIVATDSGQKQNKRCPEALLDFANALLDAGVSRERLAQMMRAEPLAAIGAACLVNP